jgi:hypothetical protein
MSAQVITALRRRAAQLDGEAASIEAQGTGETPDPGGRNARWLRWLAAEFRALADVTQDP